MSNIRLYVESEITKSVEIKISKDKIHYLKNVMKVRNNQNFFIFNPSSGEWTAKFYKNRLVPEECVRKQESDTQDIWVCFSLVKPKNVNFLIEKVSEIGVKKIFPLITEFSHKHKFKRDRLQKIAIESVEQSNGLIIPEIMEILEIKNFFEVISNDRAIILCDEKNITNPISHSLKEIKGKKFAILIGPVGGWSKNERDIFSNLDNCRKVSLGARVLKADTAAIFSLSCLRAMQMEIINE